MKKYFYPLLSILFVCATFSSLLAFDPESLAGSLVKITILENGVAKTTASGFVYRENRYIITSLHVMKPGPSIKIKVEYNNMACNAQVVKVHQRADLVLLEVIPGAAGIPAWKPLATVNTNPLKFAEQIFSVGYNSGSQASSSRTLSKGSASSEKLKDLIPNKDLLLIRDLGMPHLDLDVIYLEGSLLPGFSGAPLLNSSGHLVGIADGGLENGASNVSWGIPSREIDVLFSSTVSTLPSNIGHASVVFSAELNAPSQNKMIRFENYQFVHTKTRTLQQLIDRSDDKETLLTWLEGMADIEVGYSSISFDIYEDIVNGYIITIPHGASLTDTKELMEAKLNSGNSENYYLAYLPGNFLDDPKDQEEFSYQGVQKAKNEMADYFRDSLGLDESMMVSEDVEETKIKEFTNSYLLTSAFIIHSKEDKNDIHSYIYYKLILTRQSAIISFAVIGNYSTENMTKVAGCMQLKVNCANEATFQGYDCRESCTLTKEWILMLASINLTTLANE